MKKSIIFLVAVLMLGSGCQERKASFIKRFDSQNDMQTTIQKLKDELPKHGLILTSEFDEGKYANLLHRDKKIIFFTNPNASTDLIKCDAALSLEIPYKMAISKNYDGTVEVIYTNPEYWSLQYNVKDKNCLSIISKFAGIMNEMASKIIQK
jgi:uncharacterized protein (DUF302 family)